MCELFSFPDNLLSQSEKIALGAMYGPFLAIEMIMAIDMYKRIRRRVNSIKQD